MKSRKLEEVPENHESHQHSLQYQLTKADIIKLSVFMSPTEIKNKFGDNHCCGIATMYTIIRKYGMENTKTYNKVLKQLVMRYCPQGGDEIEFEEYVDHSIAIVKAELIAELQLKIVKQSALWDID